MTWFHSLIQIAHAKMIKEISANQELIYAVRSIEIRVENI